MDYTKFKQVMEADTAPFRSTLPAAKLVELAPADGVAAAECMIEMEGPRGKIRVHWKGAMPPDLAGLSRVLWESA